MIRTLAALSAVTLTGLVLAYGPIVWQAATDRALPRIVRVNAWLVLGIYVGIVALLVGRVIA